MSEQVQRSVLSGVNGSVSPNTFQQGPVRSVIRAIPIAVLKPMIGASEAVSKTLLGLHNTMDPNVKHDTDAKYKHRS